MKDELERERKVERERDNELFMMTREKTDASSRLQGRNDGLLLYSPPSHDHIILVSLSALSVEYQSMMASLSSALKRLYDSNRAKRYSSRHFTS